MMTSYSARVKRPRESLPFADADTRRATSSAAVAEARGTASSLAWSPRRLRLGVKLLVLLVLLLLLLLVLVLVLLLLLPKKGVEERRCPAVASARGRPLLSNDTLRRVLPKKRTLADFAAGPFAAPPLPPPPTLTWQALPRRRGAAEPAASGLSSDRCRWEEGEWVGETPQAAAATTAGAAAASSSSPRTAACSTAVDPPGHSTAGAATGRKQARSFTVPPKAPRSVTRLISTSRAAEDTRLSGT
jgi:hypothetical protein